jgi:AcrR family transcriptional regulator
MHAPREAKQVRSEQTRAQILQIALEEFSSRGFAAVSLREIAELAQVNHAMIRYHYGSKEGLWRESATYLFERLASEVPPPELSSSEPDLDVLKQYVRDYVRYCARHPEHARLMVQESIIASERLQWVSENHIKPSHEKTLVLIEKVRRSIGLAEVDPIMLLYMITSVAQMPYLLTAELQYSHDRNTLEHAAIESHADAVVKLIFRD